MVPGWLEILAKIALGWAALCAGIIVLDIASGNRQQMWIMNVVWPVTALWSGPLGFAAYFRLGRLSTQKAVDAAKKRGMEMPGKNKSFPAAVALAATHCGAGCTLGDIIAEWIHVAAPFAIAGVALFGAWALDFVAAFALGIVFQYFTIVPMRKLPPGKGLMQALKADTFSLIAWQVGMYGWMAIMRFAVFHRDLPKTDLAFWFLMQIGMAAGFLTAYPVNWWLLKKGIKERM
jgi:hypothetical protein